MSTNPTYNEYLRRIEGLGGAPKETAEDAALRRLNARGGSAVGDFLRMAAQGASFGFADELAGLGAAVVPGGKGYREARDDSRQRVEDTRFLNPGASMASEIAGAGFVPLKAGVSLAGRLTRPGAGLLGQAAGAGLAGAAVGAATGAVQGAGDNTEGGFGGLLRDTGMGAVAGGAAGGLLGGLLPVVGGTLGKSARLVDEIVRPTKASQREAARSLRQAVEEVGIPKGEIQSRLNTLGDDAVIADLSPSLARMARDARNQAPSLDRAGGPVSKLATRQAERGNRMAKAMRETAGITNSMAKGKEMAEKAVQDVRAQHYRPLEEAFPRVEGENVRNALNNLRVKAAASSVAKDVANRKRVPSFTELQDIMMDLRDDATAAKRAGRPNAARKADAAYKGLLEAMETDIPGFADAQAAFSRAAETVKSFDNGYKFWNKPAREIQASLEGKPPEAVDAFRTGMLEHWEESLRKRMGGGAGANSIVKAGEEARAQMRFMFGSDEAFNEFMQTRGLEEVYGVTWNAIAGNGTTAMQLSDALHSLPSSQGDVKSRVWEAIFNTNESRRLQAERVGEMLLGRDVAGFEQLIKQNPAATGLLNLGRGAGGTAGLIGGGLLSN